MAKSQSQSFSQNRDIIDVTRYYGIAEEQHGVRVSMDDKGRYIDNVFVERLWRIVKDEEVDLKAYRDGKDARVGIGEHFRFHNTERSHQALGYRTPAEVFISSPVEAVPWEPR